jgi:hypothetical protein
MTMSIEQPDVVDFVSIVRASGGVRLTISDHLDWDEDEGEHLLMLQEKINRYLGFIESGEIYERFPQARGRKITITVFGKFRLSEQARSFFRLTENLIRKAGFSLEFKLHRQR